MTFYENFNILFLYIKILLFRNCKNYLIIIRRNIISTAYVLHLRYFNIKNRAFLN